MPRLTIRQRALVAFHSAQALSRHPEYQADITALQAAGWVFRPDDLESPGVEVFTPQLRARARAIRERAGLRRLALPERLRALTAEEIAETYAERPLFVDIPGRAVEIVKEIIKEPKPGVRKVPDLTGASGAVCRVWRRPVPPRRLMDRHRDLNVDYWRVYDLRRQRMRERDIIRILWPDARPSDRPSHMKNYLRQRVYDYEKRAKRLIEKAYPPPPSPERPVCGYCRRRLKTFRPRQRYHPGCAARVAMARARMRAKIRRDRARAERELRAEGVIP